MQRKDSKLFADLFKKYRLRSEFESLTELCDILAEKGFVYEESTLSRWQTGSRIPIGRDTLIILVGTFIEQGGITLLNEANQLLEAAGKGYLTENELESLPSHLLRKTPFQTPRITPFFAGREREINQISKALTSGKNPLITIHGLPGVGKTVLAIRLAQLLQSRFPDGVLWSRLDVSSPMSILAKIASTYDEDISQIRDLQARSELVRSLLANKKALVILDNAQSSQQLRPLLPGHPGCAVIVTSRNSKLIALSNSTSVFLKPFSKKEVLCFFRKRLGDEWIRANKMEIEYLIESVGSLPLALDIIINKTAGPTSTSFKDFINEFRKEKQKLEKLTHEDVNIRSSFELSYLSLFPEQRRLFNSLGVFDGVDFSLEAVQAVFGRKIKLVKQGLEQLIGRSLLDYSVANRYRLHPLVKLFAKEKVKNKTFYIKAINYYIRQLNKIVGQKKYTNYPIIEKEIENILSFCHWCLENRRFELLIKLWNGVFNFLFECGLWKELFSLGERVLRISQTEKNQQIKAECCIKLGWVDFWRGNLRQSEEWLLKSLEIAKQMKDEYLTARGESYLGYIAYHRKNYKLAERLLKSALRIFEKLSNEKRISQTLIFLGHIPYKRKKFTVAEKYFKKALKISRKIKDKKRQSLALTNLGNISRLQKKYDQARAYIAESQQLIKQTNRRDGAGAWNNYRLCLLERDLENFSQAKKLLLRSQKGFRQLDMHKVLEETKTVLAQIEKKENKELDLCW